MSQCKKNGFFISSISMIGPKNFRSSAITSESIFDRSILFRLINAVQRAAIEVALLYKHRWRIELFLQMDQINLKIKTFWDESENAVRTQIWIVACTYLGTTILKKELAINRNLYEILEILSVSVFDKTP